MNPTSAAWRGLTLGAGTEFRLREVEGWEELPGPRYDKQPRARGHGVHPSRVWADERVVTLTGYCWTDTQRDALLEQLQAGLVFGGEDLEPLTITVAGRTLTCSAQILAARAVLARGEWGLGRFGWVAQWRCPDPIRYGTPGPSLSTGLPTAGGGLTYPLAYPLDYGAAGVTGQVTVVNGGTAPAPIAFRVTGGLPSGFEVSADTGGRLVYVEAVPAGQTLHADTGAGTLLAEGTSERRGNLTVADWPQVPAKGSLTLQFTSLGGAYDPAASLTVPEPRAAYW